MKKHGVVAEEAFSEYMGLAVQEIADRIKSLKQELDKFAPINKKAAEQYQQFTKQRTALVERHIELVKSEESIDELIRTLDERKDEAITRTFRQVSKSFQEIFKKLVPAGAGRLVLLRKTDDESDVLEDTVVQRSQQQAAKHRVANRTPGSIDIDNLLGVSIKVSFNSEQDEQLRIEQLSGGQKSLCALTLIFAIQQCDPAPFYLFDEIDANLDTQYRTAVANMIHSLTDNAQFICTTFRPEMLQVADAFYGVFFKDKMSSIMPITREQAMGFVDISQRRT
jgi:structural maintenance of chromosome 3 (chondroitin sulfate proteoglycan 6)